MIEQTHAEDCMDKRKIWTPVQSVLTASLFLFHSLVISSTLCVCAYGIVCVLALTVSGVIPVVFGKLALAKSLWTESLCPTTVMTCMGKCMCILCVCVTKTHLFPKCVWVQHLLRSSASILCYILVGLATLQMFLSLRGTMATAIVVMGFNANGLISSFLIIKHLPHYFETFSVEMMHCD